MKISTTYHRPEPDTVMGHKIVLTQVYSSMDKREIDMLEAICSFQYGSGTVTEVSMISNPSGGADKKY